MKASDIPEKFSVPFGNDCDPSDIRLIPVTTADPTAASLDAGFPPATLTPVGAGGTPPDGRDFNGLFFRSTGWNRWASAGAPVRYDAAFSALIGGYPQGTLLQSATTLGLFFYSTVDDNLTNPDAAGAGWTGFNLNVPPGVGGYLQFNAIGQIQLAPEAGGMLWINGYNRAIPASLVLSNSGLAASTFLFAYAYMAGATMTLELSATGFVVNANGIRQKSGDPTRTCVGIVNTNSAGQFSAQGIGVASFLNPKQLTLLGAAGSNLPISSSVPSELSPALRVSFLSLGLNSSRIDLAFIAQNAGSGNSCGILAGLDGAAAGDAGQMYSTPSNATAGAYGFYLGTPALGAHIATALGNVNGSTGAFTGRVVVTVWG